MSEKRILIVSPELAGVVAAGGIAEYVCGIGAALANRGHEVRIVVPAYGFALKRINGAAPVVQRLVVPLGPGCTEVTAVRILPGNELSDDMAATSIVFLCDHRHFASAQVANDIYAWTNHEPWAACARAVVEYLRVAEWQPDIVLCQDAHAALVPVFLRDLRRQQPDSPLTKVKTVVTIHNLLYQGLSSPDLVRYCGFDEGAFDRYAFEYYGRANPLKAGVLAADMVTTVSHTYAQEICSGEECGFGLSGVFRELRSADRLFGIVNGIDQRRWSLPGYDYKTASLPELHAQRQLIRQRLFATFDWPADGAPVIAVRCRWDEQKGIALLIDALPDLARRARMLISCWGMSADTGSRQHSLWKKFLAFAESVPLRVRVNPPGITQPDESAAHYAVSDFLLMPSRYEPCGLTQMECQRFGCLPIVRRTGGLADTVTDGENGFSFDAMTVTALLDAVDRALITTRKPGAGNAVLRCAVTQCNGWESRVGAYEALFERLSH